MQSPQWLADPVTSMQAPPQLLRPASQLSLQRPPVHTNPGSQACSQAPQWAGSLSTSTQRSPQLIRPAAQFTRHLPATQLALPPAGLLQTARTRRSCRGHARNRRIRRRKRRAPDKRSCTFPPSTRPHHARVRSKSRHSRRSFWDPKRGPHICRRIRRLRNLLRRPRPGQRCARTSAWLHRNDSRHCIRDWRCTPCRPNSC